MYSHQSGDNHRTQVVPARERRRPASHSLEKRSKIYASSLKQRKTIGISAVLFVTLVSILALVHQFGTLPAMAGALTARPQTEIREWTATTDLPQAIAQRNTVVHGDYLFVVGGKSDAGIPIATIYAARMNNDGSVGAWRAVGQMPVALYLHATVVSGNTLFVIGGWDGSDTRNEVWRATIASNGDVSNWSTTSSYPVGLDLHDAVMLNNHIYVVGGWNGTEALREVYAAPITGSTLGAWQQVGSLPTPRYRLAVTGHNGKLYVTGGFSDAEEDLASVLVASVDGINALGAWQTATPLPAARYYHKALIHDDHLVVLGGQNGGGVFDTVYRARLRTDGLLDGWQTAVPLPTAIYRFGAVTAQRNGSDMIYVTGGLRTETTYENAVYYSTAVEPPTPTPTFTPTPSPTPTATPTPTPALKLSLRNDPASWLAPGDETTYTIEYTNEGNGALRAVEIYNAIPEGVELVEGSIQNNAGGASTTGSAPGATIVWTIDEVGALSGGTVAYRVRRQVTPTPSVPLALEITVGAPATADAGDEVIYTFTLTNRSPIALNNLVITNTVPVGASYLRGADRQPAAGIVEWQIATLAADSTATVQYTVTANESLVNHDYRVVTAEGVNARGRVMAITRIDGQPPRLGDGFVVVNQGARAIWEDSRDGEATESNSVTNPSTAHLLYLPSIQR